VGCKDAEFETIVTTSPTFYLNYVGCKGEDKRGISKWLICFTLTMWDVKRYIKN